MEFYTVLEVQGAWNNTRASIVNFYDDVNQAYARLYTVLAAAAVSDLKYHAGFMIRSDGVIVAGEVFEKEAV